MCKYPLANTNMRYNNQCNVKEVWKKKKKKKEWIFFVARDSLPQKRVCCGERDSVFGLKTRTGMQSGLIAGQSEWLVGSRNGLWLKLVASRISSLDLGIQIKGRKMARFVAEWRKMKVNCTGYSKPKGIWFDLPCDRFSQSCSTLWPKFTSVCGAVLSNAWQILQNPE